MRSIFIGLLVMFVSEVFSQIDYFPGYYLDNEGNKVECLIKDYDWYNNPDSIECKSDDIGRVSHLKVDDVALFHVNASKYIRCLARIDMSSSRIDEYSLTKRPEYIEKIVFLKYLIEGEKSLLHYSGDGVERYFISIDDEVIPLVNKPYLTASGEVAKNTLYIGQLSAYLGVNVKMKNLILSASYGSKSLINVFEEYHKVVCDECISYRKTTVQRVCVYPKVGMGFTNMDVSTVGVNGSFVMNAFTSSVGLECEYVLPFNNTIWSIYLDPMFQTTAHNRAVFTNSIGEMFEASYHFNVFKLPLGFRYNNHISEKLKLSFDVSFYVPFTWKSSAYINYEGGSPDIDYLIKQRSVGTTFSVGFNYERFKLGLSNNPVIKSLFVEELSDRATYHNVMFYLAYQFEIN